MTIKIKVVDVNVLHVRFIRWFFRPFTVEAALWWLREFGREP